jgi:hypothetical protein
MDTFATYCNLVSIAPEGDRDIVAEVVRARTGVNAAPLSLGAQIPIAPTPPPAVDEESADEEEEDDDDQ